ncbi:MAG TPA: inositol monophosphatase, partial [Caldithrix sp.]|nr:inositol monophosphatase [Caldithrix sp.]
MIEVAKEAAYAAGKILTEHFKKLPKEAIREKQANDYLSFVDETSEKKIISIIQENFPDHSILAEEGGASGQSGEYRWIIDPLDGTTNYISGLPVFAVSIALQKGDEMILGVVYDPLQDELFWAEKGKGAYCNEAPIRVSDSDSLSECLIATGFPFKAKHLIHPYLNSFEDMFHACIGIRRMGAAAIDIAYVAAGRFGGFWELGLSPWDLAAGSVIVKEAGGHIS